MTAPTDADMSQAEAVLACDGWGDLRVRIALALFAAREAGEAKGRREALGEVTAGDEERATALMADCMDRDTSVAALPLRSIYLVWDAIAAALASERARQKEADAQIANLDNCWGTAARIRARKP